MVIRLYLSGWARKMSSYANFALYYDELTRNVDYAAIADFIHQLLREEGLDKGILLDAACGTGTLCEIFAAKGYDVIGADRSAEMLTQAMNKKVASGQDIIYLCQPMEELDLYGTVNAAVCTLDSINHLEGPAQVLRAFERISLFLEPGGIFIFDANTLYKHREILADNTYVYDCEDVYCVWQNSLEGDRVRIRLDLFEADGDSYYRAEEEFCETAYPKELLCSFLEQAGLSVVGIYDGYTENCPGEKTERLVFVARKKGQ